MQTQERRVFSIALLFLVFCFSVSGFAQDGLTPLPEDLGAAGLEQAIQHLRNSGRLLHTTAHPDDEDGGMLTLLSRGQGVQCTLLTLNRGEGGQNRTGSGLFDELGVLRTLELLAADRYYDVQQRFTSLADFGFSKSATESFEKWQGHDVGLADMVRVFRTLRPDVIVSRFQGSDRDGHGQHQVAGLLSREAFRAAADPTRFPEQIREGLLPWQAKKLYVDNVHEGEEYTVMLDTAQPSPLLGMTYQQFAMQGLKHQLSQGAGTWRFPNEEHHYTRYKLVDTVLPNTLSPEGHERDFFDGIDTTIFGVSKRLGQESHKSQPLVGMFRELQARLDDASVAARNNPASAARPLGEARKLRQGIESEMDRAGISAAARLDVLSHLPSLGEIDHAIALALNSTVSAKVERPAGPQAQIVVPGQEFDVTAIFSGPADAKLTSVRLVGPGDWKIAALPDDSKKPMQRRFHVQVPRTAEYTKPYYHRDNAVTDTIYKIDDPAYLTLPLMPPPLVAVAQYSADGVVSEVRSPVLSDAAFEDGTREVPVAVAPAASVLFENASRVVPLGKDTPIEVTVRVRSNLDELRDGQLSLAASTAWRVEPRSQAVDIRGKGSERVFKFFIFPETSQEERLTFRADLRIGFDDYSEGFSTVERKDLATAYYYQAATEPVSVVGVKLPYNYTVGYVMGAGDEIPATLQQIGLNLKMISPQELASGDLKRYNAIVLGIRAYDVNDDVKKYNARLLEFVQNGGTLVVQYNSGIADFNSGHYTPYSATLGRDRVSVEEAPVEILEPHEFPMMDPNEISQKDFNGWVQERGLYFMKSWDPKFVPLLESHDPGEPKQEGGLLRAWYGKGTYIYTGYSFFRQLPYGVPGAVRLFINLLSAHQ